MTMAVGSKVNNDDDDDDDDDHCTHPTAAHLAGLLYDTVWKPVKYSMPTTDWGNGSTSNIQQYDACDGVDPITGTEIKRNVILPRATFSQPIWIGLRTMYNDYTFFFT